MHHWRLEYSSSIFLLNTSVFFPFTPFSLSLTPLLSRQRLFLPSSFRLPAFLPSPISPRVLFSHRPHLSKPIPIVLTHLHYLLRALVFHVPIISYHPSFYARFLGPVLSPAIRLGLPLLLNNLSKKKKKKLVNNWKACSYSCGSYPKAGKNFEKGGMVVETFVWVHPVKRAQGMNNAITLYRYAVHTCAREHLSNLWFCKEAYRVPTETVKLFHLCPWFRHVQRYCYYFVKLVIGFLWATAACAVFQRDHCHSLLRSRVINRSVFSVIY